MTAILIRVLAAALLVLAAVNAQAKTVWECYVYNPVATQPSVQAMQRLIDSVKKQTNGELEINLHLGGSLPIKADGITSDEARCWMSVRRRGLSQARGVSNRKRMIGKIGTKND